MPPTAERDERVMKNIAFGLFGGLFFASLALAGSFEDGEAAYGRGDYATARQLWFPLASQGEVKAQNALGDLFATRKAHTSHRVYEEDTEAAIWYLKAAVHGFAPAQSNLARMYYLGWGVPRNLVQAARWRRKAADQGYAEAQVWLGKNYRDGEGVPRNYVLAYMWYSLAAASPIGIGYDAPGSRDRLAARMTPDQIAEAQRLAREWTRSLGPS
jgi:TPR repeat protein